MKQSNAMKNFLRAQWCKKHKLKILSRIFITLNSILWGCNISVDAKVHPSVGLSHHGVGVVVNGASVIGANTRIGHNVTIGNRMPTHRGAPNIGENCYIGSGAYLGGGIVIGDNVRIGANAVVIRDVPSNCTVVGNPARIIPDSQR